jgi:hypothetical protein
VIILSSDEWRELSRQANDAERDPYQQARWLLVRALADHAALSEPATAAS